MWAVLLNFQAIPGCESLVTAFFGGSLADRGSPSYLPLWRLEGSARRGITAERLQQAAFRPFLRGGSCEQSSSHPKPAAVAKKTLSHLLSRCHTHLRAPFLSPSLADGRARDPARRVPRTPRRVSVPPVAPLPTCSA